MNTFSHFVGKEDQSSGRWKVLTEYNRFFAPAKGGVQNDIHLVS